MGRRGPPKTPTELKLLRGTPGGEHKLARNEPKPKKVKNVPAPDWLEPKAVEVWERETSRLEKLGLLTEIDLNAFARYCDIYSKWDAARDFLAKNGFVYAIYHEQSPDEIARKEKKKLKYMAQFPQYTIYQQLGKDLARLEGAFGMNPAARASLNITIKKPEEGELKKKLYG